MKKLSVLQGIFVTSLVIANVVAGKVVDLNITMFGIQLLLPGAVFAYIITFLMTDVIGEVHGKEAAKQTVKIGFITQIIATVLIILTQFLPAADADVQEAYKVLLGQNYMFVIGSLAAYFASQSWDVFVFHKLRSYFVRNKGHNRDRWIWNNVSTITSQLIDTVIFIGVAFGIGFGWLWAPGMLPVLLGMMLTQYIFKIGLSLLDTPVFYLLTKGGSK